jgi:hypothetical protein
MINVVFFAWKTQHRMKPEFSLFAIQGSDVKRCTRGILWNIYSLRISQYQCNRINEDIDNNITIINMMISWIEGYSSSWCTGDVRWIVVLSWSRGIGRQRFRDREYEKEEKRSLAINHHRALVRHSVAWRVRGCRTFGYARKEPLTARRTAFAFYITARPDGDGDTVARRYRRVDNGAALITAVMAIVTNLRELDDY